MKYLEAILGHYEFATWFGTIFWTLVLLITYKLFKAPNTDAGFKLSLFWKSNRLDFLTHVLLAAVFLRSGEGFIHTIYDLVNKKLQDNEIPFQFDPDSMDVVILVAIIVLPASYLIHKYLRKRAQPKLHEEIHVHNENCKHNH